MPRNRRIDRALRTPSRVIWIVTVAILLVGAVVVIWVFSPSERQRRSVMERLALGDEAARVERLLGPPVLCPAGSLEHLRDSFPAGFPPAALEDAMRRLERETRQRWVYGVDPRQPAGCEPAEGQTEIGLGPDNRVLWYVTITGKTTVRLPDDYLPAEGAAP